MIYYNESSKIITLNTKNTTYAMQISHEKYVLHLYYGKKTEDIKPHKEKVVSFCPYDPNIGMKFSLDTVPTELSFFGSGDLRDTGIKIKNQNGDSVTRFLYKSFRIFDGRINFENMPYSRGGDKTLEITYFDEVSNCVLKSYYTVFYDTDTITRYAIFENNSVNSLLIEEAMACQLDFAKGNFEWTCLGGKYCWERNVLTHKLHFGKQSVYSERGHTSAHANNFVILQKPKTTEDSGECYAVEFVYSGDFEIQAELLYDKRVRLMVGLNRHTISWNLGAGESFTTPETILTYSARGRNGISQNMHDHLRNTIINPKFVYKKRPVVINTWEAVHFDINEDLLLEFADKAVELGIDTLVVDDGWFGGRNNDKSSLGDWYVNTEKFKNGLVSFSNKVHEKGINLGIWIEPEMINPDSDLYRSHPEWAIQCKDREGCLSRNQLLLDMTNNDAIDHVVGMIKEALKGVKLEYIKWDFNRSISEAGSLTLSKEKQCEVKHRFVLGTYRMHKLLTEAFPDVLFEGCSGGGGRFDAGILFYCPQIWTSDNTDAIDRLKNQKGTSYAYPLSANSAHVTHSCINKYEDKKNVDLDLRFKIAMGGVLGYEFNITKFNESQSQIVKKQIEEYQKVSDLVLRGDLFRLEGLLKHEFGFYVLSKDKKEFYFEYFNLRANFKEREFILKLGDKTITLKVEAKDGKFVKYKKELFYFFKVGQV
ncbi:MAG: alpha-galactosidase [Clostridiales bacterium]|nr:alpha-galactosidase [Clostridiales bacterium]